MFLHCPNHLFHVILTSLWRKDGFSYFSDSVYCIIWCQRQKDCYRQFPKLIMPLSLPRFLLHLLVIQLATVFLPFSNTSASSSSPLVSACENAEDWKTTKLLSLGKGIGGKKNFCWWGGPKMKDLERTWVSYIQEINFKKMTKVFRGSFMEFCHGVCDVSTLPQLPIKALKWL